MIRVGEISIPWGQNMFPDHSLLLKLNPDEMFEDGYDPYWKEWITIIE